MNKLHIVALSDTHGRLKHTYIPKCDVVTISGDFSALRSDRKIQKDGELCNWIVNKFIPWLVSMPCERVIITPGNHDFITEQEWFKSWFNEKLKALDEYYLGSNKGIKPSEKIVYLCYSTYTYKGFTFYGCPASDIHGWAWSTNGDYTKYLVPEGVDVMLVHQAPDYLYMGTSHFPGYTRNFGSTILLDALRERPANLPDLLLCGHIHTGDHTPGVMDVWDGNDIYSCLMANVSSINEDYDEWFYARNFVLIKEDDTTIIETWVSPAEGPSEVEHYNEREIFTVVHTVIPTQTN
jgi:Icc-related predicted phosphoesterase